MARVAVRGMVVGVGVVLAGFVLVVNGVTSWIASALLVWSAWTHRVSAIPGWELSAAIVAVAVFLFLLGVAIPRPVKDFTRFLPVGLIAATGVALGTAQWFPAVALAIGAALATRVRSAAEAAEAHIKAHEGGPPPA